MATIMRDPVILPSSKAVVDRATIKSHLLSDAKDPFNRVPLSIEQVVPGTWNSFLNTLMFLISNLAVELKAQIDAFIAERRKQKMETAMN
jgi:ubiquitin conjugation factor E4 B